MVGYSLPFFFILNKLCPISCEMSLLDTVFVLYHTLFVWLLTQSMFFGPALRR